MPVALFFVPHTEIRCIIFSKTAPKSGASTKSTLRSRLHPSDATSSVFKPSVCESQFDWSIASAGMKLRMFLEYTEPATMRIGEAGFEQLANVVSFRTLISCPWHNFPLKNVFFCHREMSFKTLLIAKNRDKYALFLPKLFAHSSSY